MWWFSAPGRQAEGVAAWSLLVMALAAKAAWPLQMKQLKD
jgi:hypothetical protein